MAIGHFSGGSDTVRDKLNELVEAVNLLSTIRGDEQYISVNRNPGGVVVSLSLDRLVASLGSSPEGYSSPGGNTGVSKLYWLKVQGTADAAPTYTPLADPQGWTVPCKLCTDRAGNGEAGAALDVVLSEPSAVCSRYPNVRGGAVLGCLKDADGAYICVTDYLDDQLHTIKMWNRDTPFGANDIPLGWQLCDGTNGTADLRSRFVVGYDSRTGGSIPTHGDSNYQSTGNTGGYRRHGYDAAAGLDENNHDDHDQQDVTLEGLDKALVPPAATTYKQHTMTDNRPPYYVIAFIERVD